MSGAMTVTIEHNSNNVYLVYAHLYFVLQASVYGVKFMTSF